MGHEFPGKNRRTTTLAGTQKLYAEAPELVVPCLRPYRTRGEISTWVRDDHASNGKVDPAWREAFVEFPDRFLVGTDTYTP